MNTNEKLSTTTEITFGEYVKYAFAVGKYDKVTPLFLLLIGITYVIFAGRLLGAVVGIVAGVLFIVLLAWGFFSKLKEMYAMDKTITEKRVFWFSPDKIEMKTVGGEVVAEFPKADIKEVRETRSNFYIITFSRKGIIVIKKNCTPELIEFIRTLKKD
ncbi:MAG: YcxB family protein [Clostridia bacterium]|nr:YcxB family protein [Clostridia bacterium]